MNYNEYYEHIEANPHVEYVWVAAFTLNYRNPFMKFDKNIKPTLCVRQGYSLRKVGKAGKPIGDNLSIRYDVEIFLTELEAVEYYLKCLEKNRQSAVNVAQQRMQEFKNLEEVVLVQKLHIKDEGL